MMASARIGFPWKSLRQRCVLAPPPPTAPIQHILRGGEKRGKDIMDALVSLRKKTSAGGQGIATADGQALVTSSLCIFYADNTAVVSRSPEKMIAVIVTV